MRCRSILYVIVSAALTADAGTTVSWKPAQHTIEVAQRALDVVLSGTLPEHWALTVVTAPQEVTHAAQISAASVDLDGPFIERVNDLDLQRLDVKPGTVRVQAKANEPGLAVCVTVPAGTHVRVLRDDLLIRASSTGFAIQDGRATPWIPKFCASVPLLQQAILGN